MTLGSRRAQRVLVTGGPTWVAIDDVRVISNTSTGEMSLWLAREAATAGLDVDLLLGPACAPGRLPARVKVQRFAFYHELSALLSEKLRAHRYDAIFHAAAVSDYLCRPVDGKISSEAGELVLRLTRAPKLVAKIRSLNPSARVVIFKLERGITDAVLVRRALIAMKQTRADLAVANTFDKAGYRAYILDQTDVAIRVASKKSVAKILIDRIKSLSS